MMATKAGRGGGGYFPPAVTDLITLRVLCIRVDSPHKSQGHTRRGILPDDVRDAVRAAAHVSKGYCWPINITL